MSTITYYAANDTMGDTSDTDCDAYREWAEAEIRAEFPDHSVEVSTDQSLKNAWTDDFDREDEILDFCHRLWDRCPWDWA